MAKSNPQPHIIDLTARGPLSVLTARRYKDNYVSVPDRFVGKYIQGLDEIRQALNPEWSPSEDSTTMLVKSDKGQFDRMYGPKVYGGGAGVVAIRWGSDVFNLEYDSEGVIQAPTGTKISLTSADKRVQLRIMVRDDKVAHILSLPLATPYETTGEDLLAQFDLDPAGILDSLMPIPGGNGGGGGVALTESSKLPQQTPMTITAVKVAGNGVILTTEKASFWSPLLLQDFFKQNTETSIGGTVTISSIEVGEKYDKVNMTFEKDGFSISGTMAMYELEVGSYLTKGHRTFRTEYGVQAIVFTEFEGFVVPVKTTGTVQSQLTSGILAEDAEVVMEIRSITPAKGSQKNPQVKASLIFDESSDDDDFDF